jgi:hypothetical protein
MTRRPALGARVRPDLGYATLPRYMAVAPRLARRTGTGFHKIAAQFGVATGTVQRIAQA